jgi:hypothetical protein
MNICKSCGKEISSKYFCNTKCQNDYRYKEYIKKWIKGEVSGNRGKHGGHLSHHVIRWIHETRNNRCEDCGFDKPHPRTRTSILEIHHKDENPENTKPENLSLLCPRCHVMTDSRDSRKGNGRRYFRQLYNNTLK